MAEKTLPDYREIMKQVNTRSKTVQNEHLVYCVNCVNKMMFLYEKIEKTEFLSYVLYMLKPAFPLFVKYFANRFWAFVNPVLPLSRDQYTEKEDILEDIDQSVTRFASAMEDIIQSTNAADRMVVQTAPVSSDLLSFSPKICAYYSMMLNSLAEILQDDKEIKYAFCVYPSLKYRSEARVLCSTMEESGKTSLIQVPCSSLLNVEYLRIVLLHEMFHVITFKNMRKRKERAVSYLHILLYAIRDELSSELPAGVAIRGERFDELIFRQIKEDVEKQFYETGENDRRFYGKKIQQFYADAFIKQLVTLPELSREKIYDTLFAGRNTQYDEYIEKMDTCEAIRVSLGKRALQLMAHNSVEEICEFYMMIFRETLSDISGVWVLKLDPDKWIRSFRHTPNTQNEYLWEPVIYLRICLVCATLMTEKENTNSRLDDKFYNRWEEWGKKAMDMAEGKARESDGFIEGIGRYLEVLFGKKREIVINAQHTDAQPQSQRRTYVLKNRNILRIYLPYFRSYWKNLLDYERRDGSRMREFDERYFVDVDSESTIWEGIANRSWEKEAASQMK